MTNELTELAREFMRGARQADKCAGPAVVSSNQTAAAKAGRSVQRRSTTSLLDPASRACDGRC
jgi:hypothetical protein